MNNPALLEELHHRVTDARSVLLRDPNYTLSFGRVMSVLALFGPRWEQNGHSDKWPYNLGLSAVEEQAMLLGRKRRRWNALLCGEKILPLWSVETVKPLLIPEDVEKLYEVDLRSELAHAKAAVLREEPLDIPNFIPRTDDLSYDLTKYKNPSKSMFQAVNAYGIIESILFVAWMDESNIFDMNRVYPETWNANPANLDEDWTGIPSAIWASEVWAGEPSSSYWPFNDTIARKSFWQWWLDEAVSASWNLEDLNLV